MEKWLETEVGSAVVVVVDEWGELERFWQAVRRTEGKATTFWRRLEKVPLEYWLRTKDLRWESVKVWEDNGLKGIEQGWLSPVIVLRVLSIENKKIDNRLHKTFPTQPLNKRKRPTSAKMQGSTMLFQIIFSITPVPVLGYN